jgi:ubiquinone/menaquinone biosynthesis C-methylase UbiE
MNATADAYDRHVGRYGSQLAAGLMAAADIRPGQRVLDVGCGPGPLTRALADTVGAEHVAAVDPSAPFVEACRARVPAADVRVGVGEQLPFPDESFDAVLAQLVVQLMDDRDAGVREMARVARPGATIAACVWDSRRMPLLRAFWDAASEAAPDRAGAIDEGRQIGYATAVELADLFARAGLLDVATGEIQVAGAYESFDELMRPFAAGVGHSGACFTSLAPATREGVRAAAHRRLGSPRDGFTLTAYAWWARGAVPT